MREGDVDKIHFQVVRRLSHLVLDGEFLGDVIKVAFTHSFETIPYILLN